MPTLPRHTPLSKEELEIVRGVALLRLEGGSEEGLTIMKAAYTTLGFAAARGDVEAAILFVYAARNVSDYYNAQMTRRVNRRLKEAAKRQRR